MENRMRRRMTVILNSKMNMRRFCVSAALLLTTLLAVAENNPYRSDVFWVTVPDHADWLYKTGEQANVEVQFYKYGIPGDSIAINFEIGGEMMPADTKGTVIMRKGKATIPVGTMKKPGFRDCRLTTTVDGKKYSHHVKVGFSPEKLRPYTTMPADFQQFWENEKAELTKFPLIYTKEHVEILDRPNRLLSHQAAGEPTRTKYLRLPVLSEERRQIPCRTMSSGRRNQDNQGTFAT